VKKKVGQGKSRAFPCRLLPHLQQPPVRDMEIRIHPRVTGTGVEAVWNGGVRIVPLGRWSQLPIWPLLNWTHEQSCSQLYALSSVQMSESAYFANFFRSTTATATSTCVSCQFLCLTFVANRRIKLGMYFQLIYYLTYAELSRKTVKCAILPPSLTHADTQTAELSRKAV
jgi:hypothetical protein